ncbi:MAG: Formylglycine-generating sulfatase enzyme [Planctomycetes bacterium ADurb.Bin412]|nr:MAG: Formylglycine-generating sulfatase enzyme [Planctomycetes bacterium ADurb.Bin412]
MFKSYAFICLLFAAALPLCAQKVAELETARERFAAGVEKIATEHQDALIAVNLKYRDALAELRKGFVARGNLDGVQAVDAELAGLDAGALPDAPDFLARPRKVFEDMTTAAVQEREQKLRRYSEAYVRHLNGLVTNLTRAERIQDALTVRTEIAAVEKDLPPVPKPVPGQTVEPSAQQPAPKTAARPTTNSSKPIEGRDWVSPSTGMEFVWIKALKCWVGKYEVTNGEYRKMKPDHDSKEFGGHSLNGDRQPVVYVNFDDAKAYAAWMAEQDKTAIGRLRYRLPIEDEWMVFAQCGKKLEYPWGNDWPPKSGQAGNYHGEEGAENWPKISGCNDGHPVTCKVEQSWENHWGLYGVGGNVWEACASNTATDQAWGAWRGASWIGNWKDHLRCLFRVSDGYGIGLDALTRKYECGFRLVLSR